MTYKLFFRRFYSPLVLAVLLLSIPFTLFAAPNWQAVEQLIKEQKIAAATTQIDVILKQSKQSQDIENWTRALVRKADYLIAQGQVENAVSFLKTEEWPDNQRSQVILSLYHANALSSYIQQYSWEINQREQLETQGKTTLKKMTMSQLVKAANTAYEYALINQGVWKDSDAGQLKHYFTEGNYPKRIRGTLQDTITYLWVNFIGNESLWSASHSNQTYKLDIQSLLTKPSIQAAQLTDEKVHPLKRISWLLAGLEQKHRNNNRPEAAFEAMRVRTERLHQSLNSTKQRDAIQQSLRVRIKQDAALPWSNMGRWTLARLLKTTDKPDALIASKAVLEECKTQHKDSEGSKRCDYLLQEILQPQFSLRAMTSDGMQKRSIEVMHKGTEKMYFRAWKVSLEDYLKQQHNKREKYLKSQLLQRTADAEWEVELPPSRDYRMHRSFVTPPMKQRGYWVVTASLDKSFVAKTPQNQTVGINLTGLLAKVKNKDKQFEVTVYQGENGQLVPNTQVELWLKDYRQPMYKVATGVTGKDGRVELPTKQHVNYIMLIKNGSDVAYVENVANYPRYERRHIKSAMTFTDRSIYRPGQKMQWKVVAYQGAQSKGKYQTIANAKGWVKLHDANGKVVAEKTVQTNNFGSASGEFDIKPGRMLGSWRLATSWKSSLPIRVEEYKRPTFSAEFEDSETALRLNKPAKVAGSARYYFGQAVTEGKVKWRVKRTPKYDWRWYSQYRPVRSAEIIATGSTALDEEGKFKLEFLPEANEEEQGGLVSYLFEVSADITDSGGETRTAKRSFRLGSVSIEAKIQADDTFGTAGKPYQLTVSRTDLDGIPRSGDAHWTLNQLQQPEKIQLPADLPKQLSEDQKKYATAGDKQNPRWDDGGKSKNWFKHWKEGQQVARGTLKHDDKGSARIDLKEYSAGIYRLHYTTLDAWGKRFETEQNIIISTPQNSLVKLPALLRAQRNSVEVGDNVQLLVGSGFKELPLTLEVYRGNKLLKRNMLRGGLRQMEFPVQQEHQGGLTFVLSAVRDYQLMRQTQQVNVPWTDRKLNVAFETFRDKLSPGQKETWRITVKDAKDRPLESGAAEVLASMYDKSLDFFARYSPADVMSLYPRITARITARSTQGVGGLLWHEYHRGNNRQPPPGFEEARLLTLLGHYGSRRFMRGGDGIMAEPVLAPAPMAMAQGRGLQAEAVNVDALQKNVVADSEDVRSEEGIQGTTSTHAESAPIQIRKNFNETAFFYPHLALEKDGSVSFEFEVPESLTEWNVWVSALTNDLRGGSVNQQVRTSKELMIRPYLPRFLREGDRAEIEVVVNNTGEKALSGNLEMEIYNPDNGQNLDKAFKLDNGQQAFNVEPGKSTHVRFGLSTPHKPGLIAIRAKASAGELSDGEQRPLPVLPSRIHLAQSRFTALHDKDSKTLKFEQLEKNNDPTRINDKLVVTVEGQLFYSVLNALPYLVEYPYECTEQTLNRYLSTAIVKSVFDKHPAVASMAKKMSQRDTQYEQWNDNDPNRKMLLEETPWLTQAEGGSKDIDKLFRILDPGVANAQRQDALQKLRKTQTASGGFPWWSGGPPSPYMTMYLLHGFSRSLEFQSDIPKDMVQRAWRYLHEEYKDELKNNDHIHNITFINYLLSSYPDTSWTGGVFSEKDRQIMLDESFKHWTKLSPLLKSYLALTLHRVGRSQDAKLVFDSIMDGAKTDSQLGTYWQPEDRSWLWFNDNVDSHAFILRTLTELNPADTRRQGVVQWLMLDKKLNHWKSTRATAESIYALVHYLKQQGQLGIEENATIKVGSGITKDFLFKPDEYTGHKNQLIVTGDEIKPEMSNITVAKESKGLMFASATWHFSTEELPKEAQGDFFNVTRKFYKRIQKDKQWTLQPLQEGATIAIGDQLEVQLSLRAKHNAEYVHLRAPRGAGYEPVSHTSAYKWDLGIGYYEEIRDSSANYFFEHLPAGEYTFKYRLRATTKGEFRVAPARVQSMYAPEFIAYSSGKRLQIK